PRSANSAVRFSNTFSSTSHNAVQRTFVFFNIAFKFAHPIPCAPISPTLRDTWLASTPEKGTKADAAKIDEIFIKSFLFIWYFLFSDFKKFNLILRAYNSPKCKEYRT